MITSFLKKRSNVTASKVGNGLDLPFKKKKKQDNENRNKERGYCAANISEVIEKMKDSEAGKWRIFNKLKVSYTIITRDWNTEIRNTENVCLHPLAWCQPCFPCTPTQETLFGIH